MTTVREGCALELSEAKGKLDSAINELSDERPDVIKVLSQLSMAEDLIADVLQELKEHSNDALFAAMNSVSDRV